MSRDSENKRRRKSIGHATGNAQAMTAVLEKNVLVGIDNKPVTDGEIRL